MVCPNCNSKKINETGEFDLTMVSAEECHHDFKCDDCGCLFTIAYAPIATKIVGQSEEIL